MATHAWLIAIMRGKVRAMATTRTRSDPFTSAEFTLSAVCAATDEGVIGRRGSIPWLISEDLKRFRTLTIGHPVIMGRRTFESIGHALDGRLNIILTRDSNFSATGAEVAHSLQEGLDLAAKSHSGEVFIIGGEAVYREALPLCKRLYLTQVHSAIKGDTHLPDHSMFRQVIRREERDTNPPSTFMILERIGR